MSAGQHIARHACRPQPTDIPSTKVVAAYGARMCASLVERLTVEALDVKANTLNALLSELIMPQQVFGCIKAGILPILTSMLSDSELLIRQRASKCLALISANATGRAAMAEVSSFLYQPIQCDSAKYVVACSDSVNRSCEC